MASVSSKSKSTKQTGAVMVSRNLQQFVLLAAGLGIVLPVVSLIPMYVLNDAGYRGDYATGIITMTMYPLLLFAVTYIYSPKYPTQLQRAFIAVIKSVALVSLVAFMSYLKNAYTTFLWVPTSANPTAPSLITSFTLDYVFIGLTLIATIFISYFRYRHKR